ncbi:MAG: SDR family oxidoreductase [Myxococcales bacterium]|nr:SDR family oxidoreductase [Myxococcales bacterium]
MGLKRHVIVTGGSRGLGAAFVEALLTDGYRVSACSRTPSDFTERMQKAHRKQFFYQACEVGNSDGVDSFVNTAIDEAGEDTLWGLINNAGIARTGILASFPNIESESILRVNLLGAIQVCRAATRYLLKSSQGGRILNISSIIGSRGYNGMAAYSASKAGMDGVTRALARELGRRQVTVNSVCPGYVETEMSSTLSSTQLAQISRRTPIGRLATEEDVVELVRFLLSDRAAMITGQCILVDGGISC